METEVKFGKFGVVVKIGSVLLRKWSEIPEDFRPAYYPIGGDWAVPDGAFDLNDVALAVNLDAEGSFDSAKPQSFFDEYIDKYGKPPFGFWFYPKGGSWVGEFLPGEKIVKRLVNLATDELAHYMECNASQFVE